MFSFVGMSKQLEESKVGRPKEGLETLPEHWYADVINLYMGGASDVEVKAYIYHNKGTFSNDLWDRWMKEEEEFSETIKTGRMLSEAWWHKEGRGALRDKDFSYTGWYMQMKNRFGWADKSDVTTGGEKLPASNLSIVSNLSTDTLRELEEALKK